MVEKTELEKAADNARDLARNILYNALLDLKEGNSFTGGIERAIDCIGQHAIALMKLTAEREHTAAQHAVVDYDEERLAQSPNWVDRRSYQQQSPKPEYTEREIEMYARGRHAERYMTSATELRPWSELSEDEKKERCGNAATLLNHVRRPGEPRK